MEIQGFDSDANQWVSARIARDHGVTLDRVMYVGHCDNDHGWRVLCFYCMERRNASPAYQEEVSGPTLLADDFTVDLKPGLDVTDNAMSKKYKVLVGECQDCGSVYFSDFEIVKEEG